MKKVLWMCLLLWAGGAAGRADFLLKTKGQSAVPLRLKVLEAQARIEGQFARTQLNYVFQNEAGGQIEAEFLCTVPRGAVVTYFAYWYGEEKVVARVVEKERAAQIYEAIKSWKRDPALVEMLSKNTFRARIFPVMPNADLKIEIHLAQTLDSDREGAVYELPLRAAEEGKGTLEQLNVLVEAAPGPERTFDGVSDNYHLRAKEENGVYRLKLKQRNFRPTKDLQVRLLRAKKALHAVLLAKRSGGSDGFFVLALTPNTALKNPRVAIHGVKTWQVFPTRLRAMAANRTVEVTGRYRGGGRATLVLSDGARRWQVPVVFRNEIENNNLATKLWAANRIAELSRNAKNMRAVIELSQRFTLPSKWTSWLAIPQAERERFAYVKAQADADYYARLLTTEILQRRENGSRARQLRLRLAEATKILRETPEQRLRWGFNRRMQELALSIVREKYGRRDARRIKALQGELKRIAAITKTSAEGFITQNEQRYIYPLATEAAREIVRLKHEDAGARQIKETQQRLTRLAQGLKQTPEDFIDAAEYERQRGELDRLSLLLGEEIIAGRFEAPKAQQLQESIDAMRRGWNNRNGWFYGGEFFRRIDEAHHARAHVLAHRLLSEKKKSTPNARRIASLEQELEAASKAAQAAPQSFLDWEKWQVDRGNPEINAREYFMRQGDPLIAIEAPADALQVVALLPGGEVKPLVYNGKAKRWQARFDIPTHAPEGPFYIKVVIVLKDGTRRTLQLRFNVDMTAPDGRGVLQTTGNKLRLEVAGDSGTARVKALLPWGTNLELSPSTQRAFGFFAVTEIPPPFAGQPLQVIYVLTDRAHNRTTLVLDMKP